MDEDTRSRPPGILVQGVCSFLTTKDASKRFNTGKLQHGIYRLCSGVISSRLHYVTRAGTQSLCCEITRRCSAMTCQSDALSQLRSHFEIPVTFISMLLHYSHRADIAFALRDSCGRPCLSVSVGQQCHALGTKAKLVLTVPSTSVKEGANMSIPALSWIGSRR